MALSVASRRQLFGLGFSPSGVLTFENLGTGVGSTAEAKATGGWRVAVRADGTPILIFSTGMAVGVAAGATVGAGNAGVEVGRLIWDD